MRIGAPYPLHAARSLSLIAICGVLVLGGCREMAGAPWWPFGGRPCAGNGESAAAPGAGLAEAGMSVPAEGWLPPTGPFVSAAIPPLVAGAPYGVDRLLPENLVLSEGKYWVVTTDRGRSPNVIALLSSTDLVNWQYVGPILDDGIVNDPRRDFDSPCLVHDGHTWYVIYSHFHGGYSTANPAPMGIAHSTSGRVEGPYVEDNARLLTPGRPGAWDGARVCEPYLFQRADGAWVMVYMGDAGDYVEQIGVAISRRGILGPYTKDRANPRIPFGPPGAIDSGTAADPWVVRYGDTYYIGYAASVTNHPPWVTTYATTQDWVTFAKSNRVILDAASGDLAAFRGAVTLVGEQYLLPYCDLGYRGKVLGFWFALARQEAAPARGPASRPTTVTPLPEPTPSALKATRPALKHTPTISVPPQR